MTYITQLTWRKVMFSLRILRLVLAGFGLVALNSSSVHGQWTTGTNINNTNSGTVSVGTTSPGGDKLIIAGNTVGGNITSHTQLYSTYDSQTNVIMELGYGTATANITPYPTIVLSKNLTSASNLLGVFQFANRSIADGSEKRIAQMAGWTDGATNSGALSFSTSSAGTLNERVRITSSGNVGIGTTSPASPAGFAKIMHLSGASNASYVVDGGGTARAEFGVSSSGGWLATADIIPLRFGTSNVEKMRIDASGNIGIGTTTPTAKLHVAGDGRLTGNLTVDGNIAAKYQDMAEWVQSSQTLSAGTVVVLDQTKSNQVIASSQAYDTRVAGVISSQPGITLGENGAGKVLVATTGRVKVKVDASAGPIQVGDLLVTSDKEGVAKKSEPLNLGGVQIHRPGTLIGKALEPLAKGTGEILVLLSLQ
jgi:hypothetical protein